MDQEFEVKELKIHTDINKVDSEEYEEIGKLEENDLQTLLKDKLIKWKGKYRGWNLRSSHHYVNHEYHIYDHKENEGYFVLGHDQLCLWLNNTFDCRRYRVFTSYPQLKAYVDNFKGVLDSPAMKFIEEQYGD